MRFPLFWGFILLMIVSCTSNIPEHNIYHNENIEEIITLAQDKNQPFCVVLIDSEVVVCSKSSTGSGSGSNYDYCQSKFRRCYSPILMGSICLQFCLTQGYWPPYSTHKCS